MNKTQITEEQLIYIFLGSSKSRLEAIRHAIDLQHEIAKTTSNFNHDVVLQSKDFGFLFYHSACLKKYKDYLLVFPEHSEFSVHHVDELEAWNIYNIKGESLE